MLGLSVSRFFTNSILTICFFALSPSSFAASFNCEDARSSMEKLICSDNNLSKLDDELSFAYKHTLSKSNTKQVIKHWQQEWLHSDEVSSCKHASCLSKLFARRTEILKSVAFNGDPTAKWNGEYERYQNGKKDTDTATLTIIGLTDNRIYASGSAIWRGENAAIGQINTGELEDIGAIKAGKAIVDGNGCSATLAIKGNELIVEEESGCGGLNVSFVGNYKKK